MRTPEARHGFARWAGRLFFGFHKGNDKKACSSRELSRRARKGAVKPIRVVGSQTDIREIGSDAKASQKCGPFAQIVPRDGWARPKLLLDIRRKSPGANSAGCGRKRNHLPHKLAVRRPQAGERRRIDVAGVFIDHRFHAAELEIRIARRSRTTRAVKTRKMPKTSGGSLLIRSQLPMVQNERRGVSEEEYPRADSA